jgi:glucuronokinase
VIGFPVRNFEATVTVGPSHVTSVDAGGEPIRLSGSGWPSDADGLERLVLAAFRRFSTDVCDLSSASRKPGTPPVGLALQGSTTIPRQVGLAGSSGIIIATLRALSRYSGVSITPFDMAEMALAIEVDDLGIAAGPLDRVIQSYESFMLLELRPPRTPGHYRPLDLSLLPPTLIAWTGTAGRPSDVTHSDLRERWERGDADVLAVVEELRSLVDRGLGFLEAGDRRAFADAVDRNFELRVSVTDVTEADAEMVQIARTVGAAAKLCGSGGAVVAVPRPGVDLQALEARYEEAGYHTVRPRIG